jgi:hypothetical protein
MISYAWLFAQMSYAVVYAPLFGTVTLKVLVRLRSELSVRLTALVQLGYDFTPPVFGWLAHTPQSLNELAQMVCGPAPLPQMLL